MLGDIVYTDDLARRWMGCAAETHDQPVIDRCFRALRGDKDARADVVRWTEQAYHGTPEELLQS